VLVTREGHIVLTSFGLSKTDLFNNKKTLTFCGNPEYLAPELLKGFEYGKEVDWWCLGTLIYELLYGIPPFYNQDVQVMYQDIMNKQLSFPNVKTPETEDILKQFLQKDPEERLCDPQLIMSNPYFSNIDWEKLKSRQITPPYVPNVSPDSIELIDPIFTSQEINEENEEPFVFEDQHLFEDFAWSSNK